VAGLNSNEWLPNMPPNISYLTRMEVTDIENKSVFRYGKNYYRKRLYSIGPRDNSMLTVAIIFINNAMIFVHANDSFCNLLFSVAATIDADTLDSAILVLLNLAFNLKSV